MKTKFKLIILSIVALVATMVGCESLEVENPNTPDLGKTLGEPSEYIDLIDGAFLTLWRATELNDPHWGLSITAQVMTSSFGNWGGWDLGRIPREAIQNNLNYTYRDMLEWPWNQLNATIGTANSILSLIEEGAKIEILVDGQLVDRTNETIAKAKALQGIAAGHVSLIFDQGFMIDESTPAEALLEPQLNGHRDVTEFAKEKLYQAIQISESNDFSVNVFNGISMTSSEFAQLLRTYIARLEVYKARNATEVTSSVDWNEVLTLTNDAFDRDFAPIGDGGINWWNRIKIQGQDGGWARISQRLLNMMDDRFVYPWPNGVATIGFNPVGDENDEPKDRRIATDFAYAGQAPFPAARGYYFYSEFRYQRFEPYRTSGFSSEMMHIPTSEVDLLRAEALVRTGGSKAAAADLINRTRVNRGGLEAITAGQSDADFYYAITYERLVELGWTAAGVGFYSRRIATSPELLPEPGTIEHFPVPARELNILGLPLYTTGGI